MVTGRMNYDPPARRKAEPVKPAGAESDYSWLGQWSQVGWSIRIHPKLTTSEWDKFYPRANETWSDKGRNYDPLKSLKVLSELFPTHYFSLVYPRCGKRTVSGRTSGGSVLISVCAARAEYTETHLKDVHGTRVALARCGRHRGQL
jgi:hypothetical protein